MLRVEGLTQRFKLNGRWRTLFEGLGFQLAPGERLAVLGRNGQGKSTLIKILGGVLSPTAGRISWGDMTVSWPLAFTGAFQGSLTGMDNIAFISRLYRRPMSEILRKTEAFAELGGALTQPIKYYSTGMRQRLAFGLSIAIDFDCYLIDEVLAVGDARFTEKCTQELFTRRAERSFVIASHDLNVVAEICNRAVFIESGQAVLYDDVQEAIAAVHATLHREPA